MEKKQQVEGPETPSGRSSPNDRPASSFPSQPGTGRDRLSAVGSRAISTDLVNSLRTLHQNERRQFSAEVTQLGGPVAWLRTYAHRTLPLFPQGLPEAVLLGETRAFWVSADQRIGECGRCPAHGGACADGKIAVPEGMVITVPSDGGIELTPCAKWREYELRQALTAWNVPPPLADARVTEPVLSPAAIEYMNNRTGWCVVTRADRRTAPDLLVPMFEFVAHAAGGSAWYDWCPRVARMLRAYFDNRGTEEDPRGRLRDATVLALDFVDPRRWQPWFVDALDELLYLRAGRTTLLATPLGIDELAQALELCGSALQTAVELEARSR